jgi:glyoxylase-like metal-dependent hydrolase (beta-lactamase superfamily II)
MLSAFGLQLIKLDLPFRLDSVNCFIAEGEKGWIVIDTGLHNEYTVNRWEEVLKDKQVSDILITHFHPDHFGYAGGLQLKTGAKVSMSKIDEDAALASWKSEPFRPLQDHYKVSGIPNDIANQLIENTMSFLSKVKPFPKVDHYFDEGEQVQIGKYSYEVIFTPGHSDGLVVFYNKEKSLLLSTDHILPKITPNISYWFHGDPNPLGTYFNSLEKLKQLDAEIVIPSHGKPFRDANDRIDEIIEHHTLRLEKTLEIIQERKTVYQVCRILFPKIETTHETRFAIGETIAHLEYLRNKGTCRRELVSGEYVYY